MYPDHRTPAAPRSLGAPLALLLLLAAGGCASVTSGLRIAPPAEGWTRESFTVSRESCRGRECRGRIAAPSGPVEVTTRVRRYAPHEIPGLDSRSRAERAISSTAGWLFRQTLYGVTDRLVIGYATRVVTGAGSGDWRLRCRVLWVDQQEIEGDRRGASRDTATERLRPIAACRSVRCPARRPLTP